jgi:glycosyltransferase involved in cell wall biosynthesis
VSRAKALNGDLYHLHDPELLLWAWFLRKSGRPVIYDMHEFVPGTITTRPWIPSAARRLLGFIWKRFEKLVLRDMPVVFAESAYSNYYGWVNRSAIVLNFPEVESLLQIEPPKTASPRIVYVGSISESRGSVVMLKAVRILQERGISVEFDCVGSASPVHKQQLEQLVSKWSLKGVRFHGYKQPADAWRIAGGATVGLAILQPEPNYVESYPTKVFEYMALKIPVVVSDFPLYRVLVQTADCGMCVPPSDAAALATVIEDLLRSPERISRLGENGRRAIVETYRWEPQLNRLESLYQAELSR